jgi:hypothetical protein
MSARPRLRELIVERGSLPCKIKRSNESLVVSGGFFVFPTRRPTLPGKGDKHVGDPVCTENLIRVDEVMESPKLAE